MRAGVGMDDADTLNLSELKDGSLAVRCWACPRPGVNCSGTKCSDAIWAQITHTR